MEYQATAKYIHHSTRKVRLVADSIRKLTPVIAMSRLSVTPKKAAKPLAGVIASALSNAKTKGVKEESLIFKKIEVMGGPAMKRWHAVSRGSAHAFKKRMTHVRIILEEKEIK